MKMNNQINHMNKLFQILRFARFIKENEYTEFAYNNKTYTIEEDDLYFRMVRPVKGINTNVYQRKLFEFDKSSRVFTIFTRNNEIICYLEDVIIDFNYPCGCGYID